MKAENKWQEIISKQDSDVNILKGFEWNFEDGILENTKSILYNGYGFAIGTYSETGDKFVVELEYPEIENLEDVELHLIGRHLGIKIDRTNVNIEDVASCFGQIKNIL